MNLCSKTRGFWTVGPRRPISIGCQQGRERASLSRWPCLLHLARGDISAVAGRARKRHSAVEFAVMHKGAARLMVW